jgi:vancomycin permeability regulator SanA
MRAPRRRVLIATLGLALLICAPSLWMAARYRATDVDRAEKLADVGLVLGAGLRPDGSPSPVLSARVATGVSLYERRVVRKLVMSGDNSRAVYDEVSAMKRLAVALGVPDEDVLLDFAGFRTLDSCVRIRKVFGQTRVVLVSQEFHLQRAQFLCADAGVRAVGFAAPDPRPARDRYKSAVREIAARWQAVIDAKILNRQPKFLGEAIDIDQPPPDALANPAEPGT